MALFSGVAFGNMFTGIACPCSLPPGWSVVWVGHLAGADYDPQE